jgi:hypothetical protein
VAKAVDDWAAEALDGLAESRHGFCPSCPEQLSLRLGWRSIYG